MSVRVGLLRQDKTLTDAEIKGIPTTPVELVAAPGAGFYIQPWLVVMKSDFSAGAYTVDAAYSQMWAQTGLVLGSALSTLALTNDSGVSPVLTQMTVFMGGDKRITSLAQGLQPADPGYIVPYFADNGGMLLSDLENQPVILTGWNAAGPSTDYTGGNAANTLKVSTYYSVEPIP